MSEDFISERIKQIIEHMGVSVMFFEKQIDTSNNSIGSGVRKKSNFSGEILKKILNKYPGISAKWLITGKGEMFVNPEENKEKLSEKDNKYILSLEKNVELLEEKLQQCQDEKKLLKNNKSNV
ncbi:hypothetical protein [Flavobacterium cupreum]|nr:hypothetical protein [Flavobacterium cupreum]